MHFQFAFQVFRVGFELEFRLGLSLELGLDESCC